jgi:predicted enzyme related to lactoylglutathione lyase
MSERPEHDRRIDYIEFPVLDLAKTRAFYEGIFGWSFQEWGDAYLSFNDGRLDGGFALSEEVHPSGGPLVILYALDLEKTLDLVREHGGAIEKEIFDFPGGRRFHFIDPNGYELAVWSDPVDGSEH